MLGNVCKASPERCRMLTLRHRTSGATKVVEYLGMFGSPLRAHVFWPGGFDSFGISPKTGRLMAEGGAGEGVKLWQLVTVDHTYILEQYRLELQRQKSANDSIK